MNDAIGCANHFIVLPMTEKNRDRAVGTTIAARKLNTILHKPTVTKIGQ